MKNIQPDKIVEQLSEHIHIKKLLRNKLKQINSYGIKNYVSKIYLNKDINVEIKDIQYEYRAFVKKNRIRMYSIDKDNTKDIGCKDLDNFFEKKYFLNEDIINDINGTLFFKRYFNIF
jgi:hypothetical protein